MSRPAAMPFPCIRCGARQVTLRQAPGRTYSYRVLPALTVPEYVKIPTCRRCQAVYIDEPTAALLEPVLAAEYKNQLSQKARKALIDLSLWVSQRELERRIDISQGYLSRIYHGHQEPSAQLVVLLALLAQEPSLLEWTTRYWAEPSARETAERSRGLTR